LFATILVRQKIINYQGSIIMKKSTIAVAALLTALSAAPVMSVAYADDASTTNSSGANCTGCKACGGCAGCKGCGGCAGCKGCGGCKGADE
jgi:hypothetical protein